MSKKNFIFSVFLLIISFNSFSQLPSYKMTDYFKVYFYQQDESICFYADADSLKNSEFQDFGENMYAFSQYLFSNYSQVQKSENYFQLRELIPDSIAIKESFNKSILSDTLFVQLYNSLLLKKDIPDIQIDSIINITCRFYYLHRVGKERIVMHRCATINEVLNLPQNEYSPYYNAFCYMVIRNEYSVGDEWLPVNEGLIFTADPNISDEELETLKIQNYEKLKSNESFKQNIINEYLRRKHYLNFKLIY